MNKGEQYIADIEKLSNLGTGICHVDGCVVFVENACPEDKVKIKITNISKSYANASISEIISPSKYRVEPFCPMQNVCGSCQLQFIDYNYQLELKRQIVKDTLHSIGGIDIDVPKTIPSPDTKCYRHKIQYPISQTKVSKRLLAGYYKPHSHDILNIKYCPIQPEICDEIIDYIREKASEYKISGYDEKTHLGELRHAIFRVSADNGDILVTLVINDKKSTKNTENFAQALYKNFESVKGVCLNFNDKSTNVILGKNTICVAGESFITEKILDKTFKIGADTFFQVNPKSAENIFSYVKEEIKKTKEPTILDAYAGIATFGIIVSDCAKKVVSVESNSSSIETAKDVLNLNNINNIELFAEDTAKYLKSVKRKFDITILDPPRKGCTKESLDATLKHTKSKIIYVSCNPATLARDLKYLAGKGCRITSVQPFDMFCHTYHVETVTVIELNQGD